MYESYLKEKVSGFKAVVAKLRLTIAVVLISISNPAAGADDNANPDTENAPGLFPGNLEFALGAHIGGGSYLGSKVRNSALPEDFYSHGVVMELTGRRAGLMLDYSTQAFESVIPSPIFDRTLKSSVLTVAMTNHVTIRPRRNYLVLRLGASRARHTFTLSDQYLERREESSSLGPYAGFSLVTTLGDHLSGDVGASARMVPIKINVLNLEDKGLQSEWSAGLTLRF